MEKLFDSTETKFKMYPSSLSKKKKIQTYRFKEIWTNFLKHARICIV